MDNKVSTIGISNQIALHTKSRKRQEKLKYYS